jgi:hypothetical protein
VALGIFKPCARVWFISEREGQATIWLASIRQGICPNKVCNTLVPSYFHADDHYRILHRPTSTAVCHGSLPVYISRSSTSSHSEAPVISPLVRQSTLAPTFSSQAPSVKYQQSEIYSTTSEPDTRSSSSQPCETETETIRPNAPSERQETSKPYELPRSSRSSQQTQRILNSTASVLTLADSTYPASSFGRGSSTYQTCEEDGSIRD